MDEMKLCAICLIVLSAVFSGTGTINSTITVRPTSAVAVINDSTIFNCSTTSEEVEWLFVSNQYSQPIIYSYGTVKPLYVSRFRVEKYASGLRNQFNLILQSVAKDYAGRYICRDPDSPNEEGRVAHLTVLETGPVCESNLNDEGLIGPNSCAIKPETVQLSCSVKYSGDQIPELQWIKTDENIAISSSVCSDSGNIYTCSLAMESELQMDGSSYVCQTTKSMTRQYNCTSDVFGVMPVLGEHMELTKTVNDKVNCSVNSNIQACTSSWIFDNGTTNWTESHERVIKFERPGRYICQAICVIRNNNCTFSAMTVNVTVNAESPDNDTDIAGIIVPVVVVVVIIVIVICAVIVYLWNRKRLNGQSASYRQHPMEMGSLLGTANAAEAFAGDIVLRKIKSMDEENRNQKVRGLTVLGDELFVAFDTSSIIEVFPINFHTPHRKFMVDGLMYPGTMAACAINSCLYVIDQFSNSSKKILKVNPNGKVIQTWETNDDDKGRISVNRDGNVVMTVYYKQKVKIYSPIGTLLRDKTIDFSRTHIIYTFHSINLADGNFIIGHGTYKSDIHQVCKFDATGNVLLSFGNKRGSGDAQLDCPAYLAERNDGSILVADRENDRIILLNAELKFVKELFTKENDNVSLPEAMYVYEKTDTPLLFLGCNETFNSGGYVLVLRLSQ